MLKTVLILITCLVPFSASGSDGNMIGQFIGNPGLNAQNALAELERYQRQENIRRAKDELQVIQSHYDRNILAMTAIFRLRHPEVMAWIQTRSVQLKPVETARGNAWDRLVSFLSRRVSRERQHHFDFSKLSPGYQIELLDYCDREATTAFNKMEGLKQHIADLEAGR